MADAGHPLRNADQIHGLEKEGSRPLALVGLAHAGSSDLANEVRTPC